MIYSLPRPAYSTSSQRRRSRVSSQIDLMGIDFPSFAHPLLDNFNDTFASDLKNHYKQSLEKACEL